MIIILKKVIDLYSDRNYSCETLQTFSCLVNCISFFKKYQQWCIQPAQQIQSVTNIYSKQGKSTKQLYGRMNEQIQKGFYLIINSLSHNIIRFLKYSQCFQKYIIQQTKYEKKIDYYIIYLTLLSSIKNLGFSYY
ncbi:hypothetical protein TTHERM_000283119 (macronuclear) [Tetrahymena thermophila SB210]|uniref:Uncharacterized protein n=1 Tax=Tetrahymena thermophila (strain SB210) TaxID=312017 RepID=W7X3J5_TETTS|nr:hypothetical protein TTHERM_000283119 [Tetrahymena thermophila SB210]EWS73865.1 hypothetical protein TTHERM_000283119 [Tetrahymena thermophila SB210]|eukprot:XP_012653612.1 hypothetical protein TTHERM_000283119 [Tetrahymena thermophila SB210]